MEEMMKSHMSEPSNTSSSTALAMHRDSQVMSKFKPKIRIIHIFAPEIIKTDVANFRELVQRLTGKPTDQKGGKKKAKRVRSEEPRTFSQRPAKMMNLRDGIQSSERSREEEVMNMWGVANPSNFLTGFADLDGFIQGLNEFPLLPLNASSHLDVFGGAQLA